MIQKVTFTPQVKFTANETPINYVEEIPQENKKDNSALILGSLTALGAFGLGMLARKPKVVEKTIERTVQKAEQAISETAQKNLQIAERTSQGTTRVSEDLIYASNPHIRPEVNPELAKLKQDMIARSALNDAERINVSTPITEEVIQNSNPQMRPRAPKKGTHEYNVQHQKKYEELMEAYNPEAYKDMKIKQINGKNASERAKVNTIGNLVKPEEKQALAKVKAQAQVAEQIAGKMKDAVYSHANGNSYIIRNGKVVKILDRNTQKGKIVEISDERKIAKHISKHNINLNELRVNTGRKTFRKAA